MGHRLKRYEKPFHFLVPEFEKEDMSQTSGVNWTVPSLSGVREKRSKMRLVRRAASLAPPHGLIRQKKCRDWTILGEAVLDKISHQVDSNSFSDPF